MIFKKKKTVNENLVNKKQRIEMILTLIHERRIMSKHDNR